MVVVLPVVCGIVVVGSSVVVGVVVVTGVFGLQSGWVSTWQFLLQIAMKHHPSWSEIL